MTVKAVVQHDRARQDVDDAVAYYLDEASEQVAHDFVDALAQAYTRISRRPATAPPYAHEMGIPGLRCQNVGRFPFLVFFVEHLDHIEVLRVLHTRRDIPTLLQPDDG